MPHYTVRPVGMIVEDLCRIPEDEWAKYAFSREPLNGKFNDEQRLDLTRQAIACGHEYAEKLAAQFGMRDPEKLAKQLGGIRNMNRTPSAMFVVDVNKEALAVEEAHKLGIPVVAIVDTNADPESVEYPIAANDDAIRGIELLTSLMADAVAEGLLERSGKASKAEGEAEQPMAAWEKELLTEGAPAADAPAEAEAEGEAKAE